MQQKFEFKTISDIYECMITSPSLYIILGEIGSGKTTLGLSFSKYLILTKNSKVLHINTRQNNSITINRIINSAELDQSLFIPLYCSSYEKMYTEILSLETYLANELAVFGKCDFGAIIVDSILEYYILEIGTDKKNSKHNSQLNFMLAALKQISDRYKIPMIITNVPKMTTRFSENNENDEVITSVLSQHGGSFMEYWGKDVLKLDRTGYKATRKLKYIKNCQETLGELTIKIENTGFI